MAHSLPKDLKPTHSINIHSSTRITNKVKFILSVLRDEQTLDSSSEMSVISGDTGNKDPTIIQLTAPSQVASKLITIVEIVKREVAKRLSSNEAPLNRMKLYQYTALSSQAPKSKAPPSAKDSTVPSLTHKSDPSAGADEDDEDVFETLDPAPKRLAVAAVPEKSNQPRQIPVLVILLSMRRLEKLRGLQWSEQVAESDSAG